jgi:acyl-CoA thioester hydrolase
VVIYEHRLRVRYAETDAMGVAHHAAYLVWFEAARVAWIRDAGFPFAEVEASGYLHAVREVRVQYRRPARFDQLLALRVAVVSAGGARMTFGYRIYDAAEADGAPEADAGGAAGGGDAATLSPLAVGSTEMIWVTPHGRPTRLPSSHPLARFLAATERHPEWAGW